MINCGNGTINLFGRIIHDAQSARAAEHGGRAGEFEQHRRDPDRAEGRRSRRCTSTCANSDSDARPGSSCRANRRACCGAWRIGRRVRSDRWRWGMKSARRRFSWRWPARRSPTAGMLVKPRLVLARQKPGEAEERFTSEKPERDHRAGDRDSDAPDDGRRGAARHRPRRTRI